MQTGPAHPQKAYFGKGLCSGSCGLQSRRLQVRLLIGRSKSRAENSPTIPSLPRSAGLLLPRHPLPALLCGGRNRFPACNIAAMSARDFINDTLLPSLAEAIAVKPHGNQHYLAGYDDTLKAIRRFLEEARPQWDVPEQIPAA